MLAAGTAVLAERGRRVTLCALTAEGLAGGTWRSPVAHLNGVQGVAGSNPAVPILEVKLGLAYAHSPESHAINPISSARPTVF